MQYKGFEITAFEQRPGKWCARITRANGKPFKARKLREFVTGIDHSSAIEALKIAMEAVDAAGRRGRSEYPLAKRKRRLRRVSGQAGTDDILREQEMSRFIRRELWLSELSAAPSHDEERSGVRNGA